MNRIAIPITATLVLLAACDETPTQQPVSATMTSEAHIVGGANGKTATLRADLGELNGSGASGQATLRLKGDILQVTLTARGLSAGVPHAQHVHIGGANVCPRPESDFAGDDGFVSTLDGAAAYGGVKISLTTEGDASAASALAVDRFPNAETNGVVTYRRDIRLPQGVTPRDIFDGVIVVHGIASLFGDPDAYDGEPRSSLTESLPLEATIPALCGEISPPGGPR